MVIIEIHQQKRDSNYSKAPLNMHDSFSIIGPSFQLGQFLDRKNLFQKKRPGSSVSLQFLEDWVVVVGETFEMGKWSYKSGL